MDYAVSPNTGEEHAARSVSYDQARGLKLLCPVCRGKVFKIIRHTPQETHYFRHHVGGSPDCELYRPGVTSESPLSAQPIVSKGQDFRLFKKSVAIDIRTLLIAAHIVRAPIDDRLLDAIAREVEVYEFDSKRESIEQVNACAFAPLNAAPVENHRKVARRLSILCGLYINPQARFVDKVLATWLAYQVVYEKQTLKSHKVVEVVVADGELFDSYAARILCGLALLYSRGNIAVVADPIRALGEQIAFGLSKAPLPKKRESKQSQAVAREEAQSQADPRQEARNQVIYREGLSQSQAVPREDAVSNSRPRWRFDANQTLHSPSEDRHLGQDEWCAVFGNGEYFVVIPAEGKPEGESIPLRDIDGRPSQRTLRYAIDMYEWRRRHARHTVGMGPRVVGDGPIRGRVNSEQERKSDVREQPDPTPKNEFAGELTFSQGTRVVKNVKTEPSYNSDYYDKEYRAMARRRR